MADDFEPALPGKPPEGIAERLPDDYEPDYTELQAQWVAARDSLLKIWPMASEKMIAEIISQIHYSVSSGDVLGLSNISAPYLDFAAEIELVMLDLAAKAAEHEVNEADRQEIEIAKGVPDKHFLSVQSQSMAQQLMSFLVASGIREALRVWGKNMTSGVSERAEAHLLSLKDAQTTYILGGGLTGAQREGRLTTALNGPGAALYSSEILDTATCKYCRVIDGRWLGNVDDPLMPWMDTYPNHGYIDCLGRDRCRGQIVYVYRGGSDYKEWVEKAAWPTEK